MLSLPLVVVSGLPRSGTSLMMAALSGGGLPLLYDQARPADLHNPRGYYEDQRVLTLGENAAWLADQQGRGVKILSHLLPKIPTTVPARVLFMRRPTSEVLASQNAMLGAQDSSRDWSALLERDLAASLQWLAQQEHLQSLEVFYPRLLAAPRQEFQKVIDFLGASLDLQAMVATVDARLYRQRGQL